MSSGKQPITGRCRAFSLVELIVCLGVVLMLVGLVVPSLSKSRESGRMTRDLALVRTCVTLVHAYCAESKGSFPLVGSSMSAVRDWWRAAAPDGSPSTVDPVGVREVGDVRAVMSACFVVPPELMEPGQTMHVDLVPVRAMTDSSVVNPAQKGAFYLQPRVVAGRRAYWNILPAEHASAGPVSFFDGSAIAARWPDFVVDPPFFEYWVGMPVYSTWHGVRGRDARQAR